MTADTLTPISLQETLPSVEEKITQTELELDPATHVTTPTPINDSFTPNENPPPQSSSSS